jgi:hypothetical protein
MNDSGIDQKKDFETFASCEERVPPELTCRIFAMMHKMVTPSLLAVFFKVALFYSLVGVVSLVICHQFGMNPFGTPNHLYEWLMTWSNHQLCMAICGAFFTAMSLLGAGCFLTSEERSVLRTKGIWQGPLLGILSLGVFMTFGAVPGVEIALYWLAGAITGSLGAIELSWRFRRISPMF